ncbi:hypothetical protein ACT7DH_11575 [Bacillus pacificus]
MPTVFFIHSKGGENHGSTVWILISILLATVGAVVGFFVRKSIAEAELMVQPMKRNVF